MVLRRCVVSRSAGLGPATALVVFVCAICDKSDECEARFVTSFAFAQSNQWLARDGCARFGRL